VKRPVLIVEDDLDCLQMVETLLMLNGYKTVTASNGAEALKIARETRPCVVLLDLMMPVMDGIQFRAAQQADSSIADIPVLIVSAHHDAEQIARRLGAAGVILKSIDTDALLDKVRVFSRAAC